MNDLQNFGILFGVAVVVYVLSFIVIRILSTLIEQFTDSSSGLVKKRLGASVRFLMAIIALNIAERYTKFEQVDDYVISKIIFLLLVAAFAMLLIKLSALVRDLLYERF